MYQEYVKDMDTFLEEKDLESRYANRTAVILTAARICEDAYGIHLDLENIKKVMVEAIYSFERRMQATPENWELMQLYKRFTEKDEDGRGKNDRYIVDAKRNYNHKEHYVAFCERKPEQFVIPKVLMGHFIEEGELSTPAFWGYDRNKGITDIGNLEGEHWESVKKEWVAQGIMIMQSDGSVTQSVDLNGISTTCYTFNWRKIAQQFGDNRVLDMTRFAHDTDVIMKY